MFNIEDYIEKYNNEKDYLVKLRYYDIILKGKKYSFVNIDGKIEKPYLKSRQLSK